MINNSKWVLTDPTTNQYGRRIDENIFEFKEGDYEDGVVQAVIDISEYTEEEIENCVSSYYSNLNEVKELYEYDWKWIVAECIFEIYHMGY